MDKSNKPNELALNNPIDRRRVEYKMGDRTLFSVSIYSMNDYRKYIGNKDVSDEDVLGNYFLKTLTICGKSLKDISENGVDPVMDEVRQTLKNNFYDLDFFIEVLIEKDARAACEKKGIKYDDQFMKDVFGIK